MEYGFLRSSRGQTSIEFLIIMVILLVYVQAVLQPFLVNTQNAVRDTERMAQARAGAEQLAGAINQVGAASGESRITLNIAVPKKTFISCQDTAKQIGFEVHLENITVNGQEFGQIPECLNGICRSAVNVFNNLQLNCGWNQLSGESISKAKVRVEKTSAGLVTVNVVQ